MAESAGMLEIEVRVLPDEKSNTLDIGLPLGVRFTSNNGSAVGKHQWNSRPTTYP